ncbi:hypothetical protein [Actinomadura macrotermitis]|uniref:Abortive infection protein n=1 Tax=Actinomadura macrotermitis TaxID=2585200 RepID=A0A7K0BTH5_9ACTN|nr:hypothetical protein [Actinomadura macrotermitis]MQY04447.1 hypothetical protein [Actinomadura macrotermitis]
MRTRGINYDTGFLPGGKNTRPDFDPADVPEHMRLIAEELHCTAVRITGGHPERIDAAARAAAAAGLEVWFAPFPCELTADEMLEVYADCADRAEEIRRGGAEVVLVLGCETSLFGAGFIPGENVYARISAFASGDPELYKAMGDVPKLLNDFLAESARVARARFGGRITYAAGVWEKVDWSPFDLVAVDAYRSADNAERYTAEVRALRDHGKPAVVSEFGCCAYQGAAGRGAMGWAIVDSDVTPPRLTGTFVRDEQEQVRYLNELLAVFEEEGLDGAFWFTFAGFGLTHTPGDPGHDLDMASFGVVKVGADGTLSPKASFHALAAAYDG